MKKTLRNREGFPTTLGPTNAAGASPGTDVSAFQSHGLPPDATHQPSLSTREVAVSDHFTIAGLALPLPECLKKRPFFDSLLRTVVGRSNDEQKQLNDMADRILRSMRVPRAKVEDKLQFLDDADRESLCRLFCGEDATVLITKESRQIDFIVLPQCDDLALLERLTKNCLSTPVAARLLCAAMLAVRDKPERAARLLKSYCRLITETTKPLPAFPLGLKGLIDAVQAGESGCLLPNELYALKQHFDITAANEVDPPKAAALANNANSLAVDAVQLLTPGDRTQRQRLQYSVMQAIEAGDVPTVPPNTEQAHEIADDAYAEVKDLLPEIGNEDGVYVCKQRNEAATDQHGTIRPEALKAYLELAVKAEGFLHPRFVNAFITYGKDLPDSPFTAEATRSLWIEFMRANPQDIDAATTYWLATVNTNAGPATLMKSLPSREELQTLLLVSAPRGAVAVQRVHLIHTSLAKIASDNAIPDFMGLLANTVHRTYERILAGGVGLLLSHFDKIIPRSEELQFLPNAHHQGLIERALMLPPRPAAVLVRQLVTQLADKDLEALAAALELDADQTPLGDILNYLQKTLKSTAPSSDIAVLLSSALISRLMQRGLTDDECGQLAQLSMTLAVPRPSESLTGCLTRFFKQVGEQLMREGKPVESFDQRFALLEKGLALRLTPEHLATMQPEQRHNAHLALGACFAGRSLLSDDVLFDSADLVVGRLQAPPRLSDPPHRIARGYVYLCLHHHFKTLVDPTGLAREVAERYLASTSQELAVSWPELNPLIDLGGAPVELLSDAALQFLRAVRDASGKYSALRFPHDHPATRGQERLRDLFFG